MKKHPSLKNEDIHLLFESVSHLLTQKGFQRRDMTWYSYSPEVIRVLNFYPGQTWYWMRFAVGVALPALDGVDDPTAWDSIRPLRCRATHPQLEECALFIRLEHLVDNRTRYEELADFRDSSHLHSDSIPEMLEAITKYALPLLESFRTLDDVRRFVQSAKSPHLIIRELAKPILFAGNDPT